MSCGWGEVPVCILPSKYYFVGPLSLLSPPPISPFPHPHSLFLTLSPLSLPAPLFLPTFVFPPAPLHPSPVMITSTVSFLSLELRTEVSQIVYVTDRNLVAVERNRLLIPPTFTRYFTWGYPDHSGRIALVEGDRVRGRGREGRGR